MISRSGRDTSRPKRREGERVREREHKTALKLKRCHNDITSFSSPGNLGKHEAPTHHVKHIIKKQHAANFVVRAFAIDCVLPKLSVPAVNCRRASEFEVHSHCPCALGADKTMIHESVARRSREEMALKGSPALYAHLAMAGVSLTWNHLAAFESPLAPSSQPPRTMLATSVLATSCRP